MRYHEAREGLMPDILIRGLDEGTVARLDDLASQSGVSRNAVIHGIISQATRVPAAMDKDETRHVLGLLNDLGDPEVMAGAWR